jgi:hypothetical protein
VQIWKFDKKLRDPILLQLAVHVGTGQTNKKIPRPRFSKLIRNRNISTSVHLGHSRFLTKRCRDPIFPQLAVRVGTGQTKKSLPGRVSQNSSATEIFHHPSGLDIAVFTKRCRGPQICADLEI